VEYPKISERYHYPVFKRMHPRHQRFIREVVFKKTTPLIFLHNTEISTDLNENFRQYSRGNARSNISENNLKHSVCKLSWASFLTHR